MTKDLPTTGGVELSEADWRKELMNDIPSRMRHLKRDHRGYPWPFLMTDDSIITMDGRKQERCVREKLCMICGRKLDKKMWAIGGRQTAVNRLLVDPVMHEECARYSLKVCPFLANQDMKYRKKYDPGTTMKVGVAPERHDTSLLMRTSGFKPIIVKGDVYILCKRWDYVEHWRNGEIVETPIDLSMSALRNTIGACDPGGMLHGLYRRVL